MGPGTNGVKIRHFRLKAGDWKLPARFLMPHRPFGSAQGRLSCRWGKGLEATEAALNPHPPLPPPAERRAAGEGEYGCGWGG